MAMVQPAPASNTTTRGHAMSSDDEKQSFSFAPEAADPRAAGLTGGHGFKVLSVDDDDAFQRTLAYALRDFRFGDQSIDLMFAQSMQQGARMLTQHPDIAVVLLDVVMESDDAGLRLVRAARETLGNQELRIVLLTGQPGMAPMRDTIASLDVNDYWNKSELTAERLVSTLTVCLRDWRQITAINRARRGLQLIVEASNSMLYSHSLREFCDRILAYVTTLLEVPCEGLVCVVDGTGQQVPRHILAAAGCYAGYAGRDIAAMTDGHAIAALNECLATRSDVRIEGGEALFLAGPDGGPDCAVFVSSPHPLTETERELLNVFTSHAKSGLMNLSLVSRLDQVAYHDAVFNLPNRNALIRSLRALRDAPGALPHTLMLVDIDDFSRSNLALGFDQGDVLLREVVALLQQHFPRPVQVARLHDDLFAILGPTDLISDESIAALSDGGQHINLSIARLALNDFPGAPDDALPMASLVLKQAKSRGYRQYAAYAPGQEAEMTRRYTLSRELRAAILAGEIRIMLQPQVDLNNGRIVGAEALARWFRPDGSVVPPDEFIPVAEANGDIIALGAVILRQAASAARELSQHTGAPFRVAVNVSALQLARGSLLDSLLEACASEGISTRQIELEVTETVAMQHGGGAVAQLRRLHEAGFPIAIDDFGTGFSSLAYLRELPTTILKIDRCFISEIGRIGDEAAIADMILRLAKRLRLTTIAEGIETAAQQAWLHARGCDLGQGYHFARPLALEALIARLAAPADDQGAE
jgi:EAL domain-containing protein (putative c-di-GMP-specific phosphodiesterase class I)/PleD family two-component response regulator